MLLVVLERPPSAEAIPEAAALSGLSPSDVVLRLTGTLPRVLLANASAERVAQLATSLDRLGFVTAACDPTRVTRDEDRVRVRTLEPMDAGFVALDRRGQAHPCPASSVALLQRGLRREVDGLGNPVTRRGLLQWTPLGALLSRFGRTSARNVERHDPLLVVQRSDGAPDLVLYQNRLSYAFLAGALQRTAAANFALTVDWLRARAPMAPYDERAAHLLYLSALPPAPLDPSDLALHLVALDRRRIAPYR